MNDEEDKVEIQGDDGKEQQQTPLENVTTDKPVAAVDAAQKIVNESPVLHEDNDESKEKKGISSKEELEMINTMQLLGEPLVTHGSYTFYSGLAYRKRGEVTQKKRRRWKKRQSGVKIGHDDKSAAAATESSDSSSSSCCCGGDDANNDLCSCDGSSSSSLSKWSIIHMNHFYPVRPWYSKKNNSTSDRQELRQQQCRRRENQSPKSSTSAATAAERQQHHHQQSVCIGELELLWRDDSVVTAPTAPLSTLKKPSDNKGMSEPSSTMVSSTNSGGDHMNAVTSNNNSHAAAVASSGDDDCVRNDKNPAALLPRRMLPRRTRQPSAKKLEAAESYAAAAAAAAPDHPSQQQSYRRNRPSTTLTSIPASISTPQTSPDTHYRHGNVLCSVRLYVMPDQTAAGRLSGVHGEDEVLEINTWGANGGVDSWSNNVFINGGSGIGSIYNGGGGVDDYGYGSGSHSSGKLPSGCSGLVLRAEDFIEWVRGGLMNDDEENENTDFDEELSESINDDSCSNDKKHIETEVPKPEDEQQSLSTVVNSEVKQCDNDNEKTQYDNKISKVKLESTVTVDLEKNEELVALKPDELKKEKESLLGIALNQDKVKQEQEEPTADFDLDDNEAKMMKDKPNYDDKNHFMKSTVDEAVKAECVPLAAAKIDERYKQQAVHCRRHRCHRQHRRLNNKSLVNGNETVTISKSAENKVDNKRDSGQICYCYCCKRRRQCNNKKTKAYKNSGSSNKQRLVIMSYSRYCRYRAQLQRKREEQFNEENSKVAISDKEQTVMATNLGVDNMLSTRVLFCRDTYDYPAELLLEPFNMQQSQQQNTTVLVSHMAPKLKGWPSYPASWMSFRWNRVRRQLRHLERGNGSNDDQRRRRRRRKLKKKCHQGQNGASGTTGIMNYSSSTDDDDDSDSDDGSSATNDTNSTSTSSTSDSDGARSSSMVAVKIANKNYSASTSKENGSIHQNKKTFSVASANNMIIFNGGSVSANTITKRSAVAVVNPGQQQSTKRRRVVYTTGGQPQFQQQRIIYQQQHPRHKQPQQLQSSNQRFKQSELLSQFSQSRHQQMMVAHQHQQRLQSFNKRFPTPISSLQSSTSRVIHHHLPPSVTIMPVTVPSSNVATNQQQHRFNNRLQSKQKQHTVSAVSQRRNSDQQQMSNPAIMKYSNDKKHEYVSDDNVRYKKSTMVAAIAACHRRIERQDFEDDQIQQREDEERQRRWLVDALRLGGLEVTAVPLKSSTNSKNDGGVDSKDTSAVVKIDSLQQQHQQQRSWRQRATSLESLTTANNDFYNGDVVQNELHHGGDYHDDNSNPESDSDSIIMTVTPDVVSILNKTQQHRPHQQQLSPKSVSNSTTSSMIGHHQRSMVNIKNNISSNKPQKPVSTTAVTAAVLHDKINRAIDSLKQQQQYKPNTTNNRNNNELVIGGTNHPQSNNDNNNKQQQQQRRHKTSSMVGVQHQQNLTTRPLLDLTVKSLAAPNSNTIRQQLQKKSLSPFLPTSTIGSSSAAANLEISILPVTTSTANNIIKILPQQKPISSIVHNNLTSGSKSVACSSSVTVRQQLQRRNVAPASTTITSASVLNVQGINQNQRRNERGMSETEKTISQDQQVIILDTPKTAVSQSQSQQQDNKHKPQ